MSGRFFVDWELWQQMTFVLACAIAVVFAIGFVKLWWTNRYMAKLEIIDAEKRAHASEMESTGLPPPRKQSDIPFGVRAIQSGIEVDGIWISRPGTPATDSPPNSAKGKGKYVAQAPVSPSSPTNSDPFNSPASSSRGGNNYGPQTYRPKSMSSQGRVTSQADALRRLEGEPSANVTYQTYQPRGAGAAAMHDDEYGPTDRISGDYGVDVRVPIRPPPVNRHLNNARGGGSPPQPKVTGVRSFSGSLQIPNNGKKGYSTVPQGSPGGEFSDPFASPSRSPVTTPGADHALLPSQQGHHVTFAPDEYITAHHDHHRHPSDGSSGSSSSSRS
ncbi:hypothetical protein K4K61_006233 [Colletotrichum sp. SAR11_59]|uniref:Uncharacterized protein n=1 Tax=Colletotrichum asianum TaxID=702518 RepID=A0A8H3WFR4_9PEZI|nr:hypothetical protein GQ607_006422 [Colletotrichum asianum]KAI8304343.1 hypothetical protein K4K61_006233 [Colletotrichum sp. SAR11_59]